MTTEENEISVKHCGGY